MERRDISWYISALLNDQLLHGINLIMISTSCLLAWPSYTICSPLGQHQLPISTDLCKNGTLHDTFDLPLSPFTSSPSGSVVIWHERTHTLHTMQCASLVAIWSSANELKSCFLFYSIEAHCTLHIGCYCTCIVCSVGGTECGGWEYRPAVHGDRGPPSQPPPVATAAVLHILHGRWCWQKLHHPRNIPAHLS